MSLIGAGVDHVAGEGVVLQAVAELPPGRQLRVDLVASLHLHNDNLKVAAHVTWVTVNSGPPRLFAASVLALLCSREASCCFPLLT